MIDQPRVTIRYVEDKASHLTYSLYEGQGRDAALFRIGKPAGPVYDVALSDGAIVKGLTLADADALAKHYVRTGLDELP